MHVRILPAADANPMRLPYLLNEEQEKLPTIKSTFPCSCRGVGTDSSCPPCKYRNICKQSSSCATTCACMSLTHLNKNHINLQVGTAVAVRTKRAPQRLLLLHSHLSCGKATTSQANRECRNPYAPAPLIFYIVASNVACTC